MDITFEVLDPDERHSSHFVVVAIFESGERLEVIGFKVRRDAVIICDKLRQIYRNCKKCPKKKASSGKRLWISLLRNIRSRRMGLEQVDQTDPVKDNQGHEDQSRNASVFRGVLDSAPEP